MASNSETLNYSELCKAVVDVGTQILRDILNRKLTPNRIRKQLHQSSSKHIKLSAEQWEYINHAPTSGYFHFDISLIYTLLSQMLTLSVDPPTRGWGVENLPESSEQTLGDDIERIRLARKFVIAHIHDKTVSNDDFTKYSQLMIGVATAMEERFGATYVNDLSVIFNGPLTEEEREQSIQQIEKMATDVENENPVMKNTNTLINVKTTMLSAERKNYIRLAQLCFKYGTRCVKTVFDKYFPPAQLNRELQNNKQKLFDLRKHGILTSSDWDILYPNSKVPSGMVATSVKAPDPTSAKFDVSLMIKLLRNLSTIKPPIKGWSGNPDDTDISEGADVCRIRECRNKIAHNINGKLNIVKFKTNWKELKKAVNRISANAFQQDIKALKYISLDGSDRDEEIESLQSTIDMCKKEIEENKSTVSESVRALHARLIYGWKEENTAFIETRASRHIFASLINKHVVTITGNFGTGKTSISRHCALNLAKEGYSVHPIFSPTDISEYIDLTKKQVFVVDDPIGTYGLDKKKYVTWCDNQERLLACLGTKTKIIFTVRKLVINDAFVKSRESILHQNVIDVNSDKLLMSEREKSKVLAKHLKCHHITVSDKTISSIACTTNTNHFPLMCRIFANNMSFQGEITSFFQNPFACLQEDIGRLKLNNKRNYCALVVCAIFKCLDVNYINVFEISQEDKTKIVELINACGLWTLAPLVDLKSALHSLLGEYLKLEDNCYVFIHQVVSDAVLYHFGQDYPNKALGYCSSAFIRHHIKLSTFDLKTEMKTEHQHILTINESAYSEYFDRLFDDIEKGQYSDVFCNPHMTDEKFVKKFCERLEERGKEFVIDLFTGMPDQESTDTILSFLSSVIKTTQMNVKQFLFIFCSYPLECVVVTENEVLFNFLYSVFKEKKPDVLKDIDLLGLACLSGNVLVFKTITEDENITEKSELDGLLFFSIFGNSKEIFESLISYGADIKRLQIPGISLVQFVAMFGNCYIQAKLLQDRADITTSDSTSCFFDMFEENTDISIADILKLYTDMHHNKSIDWTPDRFKDLKGRIRKDESGVINFYANDFIHAFDIRTMPPIHLAASQGRYDAVHLLIQHNADINQLDCNGLTPLHTASENGHRNVVELLLKVSGETVVLYDRSLNENYQIQNLDTAKTTNKTTFPTVTTDACTSNITELPKQQNTYINKCSKYGTSLLLASLNGHCNVVEFLIQNNADINMCGYEEWTPLSAACRTGQKETVKLLKKHNADIRKCTKNGESPLFLAALSGHFEIVELLIQYHADINECDNSGRTPLFIASFNGHYEVVELLIEHHADINKRANNGFSPLLTASYHGHHYVVEILIQHHADINECRSDGASCLYIASQNGHHNVVELLIQHNADLNKCDNEGRSPVWVACVSGHCEVVELLIQHDADLKKCDNEGGTPAYVASVSGHIKVVELLIQHKADINKCRKDGNSPLYISSAKGYHDIVELLIQHDADINTCNNKGITPLCIACNNGHNEVVELLIKDHADVNTCSNNGMSPLFSVSQNGHCGIAELLIQHNADLNKCDNQGRSPVWAACSSGHREVVELLIQHNADLNKCDNEGRSPVWVTCINEHREVVELLIQHNADLNKCDNEGRTPAYEASFSGHVKVLEVLIQHKANINKCTKKGESPLYIASVNGHHKIVEQLIQHDADINTCNNEGLTPVCVACYNGHNEVVELLIKDHANVNTCSKIGLFPLFSASQNGHCGIAELLIQHNADINKCVDSGASPLFAASFGGHHGVVRMLIQHHADISKCKNDGASCLYIASLKGYSKVVELLIQHNADLNKCDNEGKSPVWAACINGHREVVELLIQHNADLKKCDNEGKSPVWAACINGHREVVELLIQHKADLNKCDNEGSTPVWAACINGHREVVELLIQHSADLNKCDNEGRSPLWAACFNEHREVVKLLLQHNAYIPPC